MCTSCDSGTCLAFGGYFTFNSDGTFTGLDHEQHYFYTPETGAVYDENSPGRGAQELGGTYTFDGSTLVMTFTYIEWVDLTEPEIQTWQVSIRNGCLTMTGSYTRTLYKGNLDEAAARLFG